MGPMATGAAACGCGPSGWHRPLSSGPCVPGRVPRGAGGRPVSCGRPLPTSSWLRVHIFSRESKEIRLDVLLRVLFWLFHSNRFRHDEVIFSSEGRDSPWVAPKRVCDGPRAPAPPRPHLPWGASPSSSAVSGISEACHAPANTRGRRPLSKGAALWGSSAVFTGPCRV